MVTSFEFQLHPVDPVMLGGDLTYTWEDAPAMLRHFIEFSAHAPDAFYLDATAIRLPDDQRFLVLGVCHSGPRSEAEKAVAELRKVRRPTRDEVKLQPYVRIQASGDEGTAPGHKYYIKGGFVQHSSPALVDAVIATIAEAKLPVLQAAGFPPLRGAVSRVRAGATAFAQRAAEYGVFVFSTWDDPALSALVGEWARSAFARIEPHTFGFYVNEYNGEDVARLRDTYGANFARLAELKSKYDPGNLFRLNANIAPKKA